MSDRERTPLLTIEDVSEFIGLPVSTIYSQRYKRVGVGALALRIGRHLRWRPEDIDRWLDEQSEQARKEADR